MGGGCGVDLRRFGLCLALKRLGGELGQWRVMVHAQGLFQQRAGQAIALRTRPVAKAGCNPRHAGIAVGLGQLLGAERRAVFLEFRCPVAQHQVREIQVELVRRHIGALGHEAHVAERAGIHDRLEILAVDGIQLQRGRLVDQIEQFRERITQIEATAATVTDIEDAPQFLIDLRRIGEIGAFPFNRMTGRCL